MNYKLENLFIWENINVFFKAQPKPQLTWAEWLYFQLIQPPTHLGKFIS